MAIFNSYFDITRGYKPCPCSPNIQCHQTVIVQLRRLGMVKSMGYGGSLQDGPTGWGPRKRWRFRVQLGYGCG
jgi:hypothetical protein